MTPRVPILMFHSISVAQPHARTPSLYLSPRRFRSYLAHISRLGFRGVSMSEATRHLDATGTKRPEKVVCLTFDDGFADNAEAALPILRDFGFTATCYVTSGLLGSYNAWDSDLLRVRTRMMSRAQVREWHDAGMEVGAHTRTHCDLTSCADARERKEEIDGSKAESVALPIPQARQRPRYRGLIDLDLPHPCGGSLGLRSPITTNSLSWPSQTQTPPEPSSQHFVN